ncbi:MAG TPA: NAD-dependent deacylase [Nitrososphaeraceae archaeon]|nr:NAD-dependent deacylase [Nitrososphaeraceae archaeon]
MNTNNTDKTNYLNTIQNIKDKILDLDKIVFLTGAGISKESGIPTFRGPEGLWRQYDPMKLASISGFYEDPKLVWEFYKSRQELICNCSPNLGHSSIANFEKTKKLSYILTQNIDGLHERAGSNNIVELHGNILKIKCTKCNFKDKLKERLVDDDFLPPMCKICKSVLRPSIILFGEPLDQQVWEQAEQISNNCDVMFIIGTSLNVGPVNQLPLYAKRNSAILVEVNPEPTIFTGLMDYSIQGPAAKLLPKLLDVPKK